MIFSPKARFFGTAGTHQLLWPFSWKGAAGMHTKLLTVTMRALRREAMQATADSHRRCMRLIVCRKFQCTMHLAWRVTRLWLSRWPSLMLVDQVRRDAADVLVQRSRSKTNKRYHERRMLWQYYTLIAGFGSVLDFQGLYWRVRKCSPIS